MKLGKLFLIIVVIACIGLTVWQFDNLKIIAHEYWAVKKFYHYTEHGWQHRQPLIDAKIARIDPEAAAIINYLYWCGDDDKYNPMDILAENVLKFPNNQYFLYELSRRAYFGYEDGLDPNAMLKLANRLIELDNNNINYHYLKAYALLHLRKGNNFDDVVQTIKQTAMCKNNKPPYLIYKERVIATAKKQGLPKSIIQNLRFIFEYNSFVRKIYDTLLQYENFLIIENDYAKADEISNVLIAMLPDEFREPFCNINRGVHPLRLYGLGVGAGRWRIPQQMELQLRELSKQEADKKRLGMCAIAFPDKKVDFINEFYDDDYDKRVFGIAILPFLFYARTALVFLFITTVLKILSLLNKNKLQDKMSKAAFCRYFIFVAVFFIAFVSPMLMGIRTCCFNYQDFLLLKPPTLEALKDLMEAPKRYLILPLVPFATVFCFGVISFFKRGFDNIVTRFISAVLLAIPFGLATLILQGSTYFKYLPFILFFVFAFKYSFRKITVRKILKVFTVTCDEDIAALRSNMLAFSVINLILCWFASILLSYPAKISMDEKPAQRNFYSYSFTSNYEKTYQDFLHKIEDKSLPMSSVMRTVPLIKTDDLQNFMEKFKNRKFPSEFRSMPYAHGMPGYKEYHEMDERSITYLLQTASRDQMPVILKYLNNPDNEMALVFRAQLGDKTVKNKLENILQKMAADPNQPEAEQRCDYNEMEPRESQVVLAMACISEPNQAFDYIKEFYKRCGKDDVFGWRRFEYESFCMLPKEVVRGFHNFYLDEVENKIKDSNNNEKFTWLSPFYHGFEPMYLDNQTAQRMLKIFLTQNTADNEIGRFGIEYYLTADSAELLLKGLQSGNDEFRAWFLCQLGKIHYKFSDEQLQKLANDESWKVRANLAIIDKSLIKDNEPSVFVKLLKSL